MLKRTNEHTHKQSLHDERVREKERKENRLLLSLMSSFVDGGWFSRGLSSDQNTRVFSKHDVDNSLGFTEHGTTTKIRARGRERESDDDIERRRREASS